MKRPKSLPGLTKTIISYFLIKNESSELKQWSMINFLVLQMPSPKKYGLILMLLTSHICNYGQSINYSDPISYYIPQDFTFKIAGKVGNTIHVWKMPRSLLGEIKKDPVISLFIFSDKMKLIGEKDIRIKDVTVTRVDLEFRISGDACYVNINCYNGSSHLQRQLVKVNERGNFTDFTSHLDRWTNMDSSFTFHQEDVVNALQYSLIRNNKHLMGAHTAQIKALPADTSELDNYRISGYKIIIQKTELDNPNSLEEVEYSSPTFIFDHPRIIMDEGKSIWVCSSKATHSAENIKDSSIAYSFFVVKLDSGLEEQSGGPKFIKNKLSDKIKNKPYSLERIFVIDQNLFLISQDANPYNPYETDLLRITKVGQTTNILMDTLININSGNSSLFLANSYFSFSKNEITFLCIQHFPHKLNGIRCLVISNNYIKEKDIQVNPRYDYILPIAKSIDENTFIIPYTHSGKIGFIKCGHISL